MIVMKAYLIKLLPKKSRYVASAVFPFIVVKRGYVAGPNHAEIMQHECIHLFQQREMLVVFAYLVYVLEFVVRLSVLRDRHKAYRAVSMEQEAYLNERVKGYLESRKPYAWIKFVTKGWTK